MKTLKILILRHQKKQKSLGKQENKTINSAEPDNFTVVSTDKSLLQFKSKIQDEILEIFEQEIGKINQNKEQQEELDSINRSVKDIVKI